MFRVICFPVFRECRFACLHFFFFFSVISCGGTALGEREREREIERERETIFLSFAALFIDLGAGCFGTAV